MKKLLSVASAAALLASAPLAMAEGPDQSAELKLKGKIENYCAFKVNAGVDKFNVPLDGSQVTLSSIDYKCNAPGGFKREISSQNAGKLKGPGADIDYKVMHGGGSGLSFGWLQLNTPHFTSLSGSDAFASGQTGSFSFKTNEDVTHKRIAGYYKDTVTIAITAN